MRKWMKLLYCRLRIMRWETTWYMANLPIPTQGTDWKFRRRNQIIIWLTPVPILVWSWPPTNCDSTKKFLFLLSIFGIFLFYEAFSEETAKDQSVSVEIFQASELNLKARTSCENRKNKGSDVDSFVTRGRNISRLCGEPQHEKAYYGPSNVTSMRLLHVVVPPVNTSGPSYEKCMISTQRDRPEYLGCHIRNRNHGRGACPRRCRWYNFFVLIWFAIPTEAR